MAILELQNLKKYYATHKAVDDISFSIPEGSIFGLLGPNGAGKTTLLRMITGIFYPDSGQIFFEGKNLMRLMTFQKLVTCLKKEACIKK
jgi:ABC-2 type transport system ATP-binding protein